MILIVAPDASLHAMENIPHPHEQSPDQTRNGSVDVFSMVKDTALSESRGITEGYKTA